METDWLYSTSQWVVENNVLNEHYLVKPENDDNMPTAGRHVDVSQLTDEECSKVIDVISKDILLRKSEKERVAYVNKRFDDFRKSVMLANSYRKKRISFDDYCLVCGKHLFTFICLFNLGQECISCEYLCCSECRKVLILEGDDWADRCYICKLCIQKRECKKKTFEWFHELVEKRFKRFGSAKVLRAIYKQKSSVEPRVITLLAHCRELQPTRTISISSLQKKFSFNYATNPLSPQDNGENVVYSSSYHDQTVESTTSFGGRVSTRKPKVLMHRYQKNNRKRSETEQNLDGKVCDNDYGQNTNKHDIHDNGNEQTEENDDGIFVETEDPGENENSRQDIIHASTSVLVNASMENSIMEEKIGKTSTQLSQVSVEWERDSSEQSVFDDSKLAVNIEVVNNAEEGSDNLITRTISNHNIEPGKLGKCKMDDKENEENEKLGEKDQDRTVEIERHHLIPLVGFFGLVSLSFAICFVVALFSMIGHVFESELKDEDIE